MSRMVEYTVSKKQISKEDLDKVLMIQRNSYGIEYLEDKETFERMIDVYPSGSFAVYVDGEFAGYMFFHPYFEDQVKPLNYKLELKGAEDCMYVHDMAIDGKYRERGLSKVLMEELNRETQANGFSKQCLISVPSSQGFWERYGFQLSKIVESYGGDKAYYMKKRLR